MGSFDPFSGPHAVHLIQNQVLSIDNKVVIRRGGTFDNIEDFRSVILPLEGNNALNGVDQRRSIIAHVSSPRRNRPLFHILSAECLIKTNRQLVRVHFAMRCLSAHLPYRPHYVGA
jgi:hypothetical protein